MPRGSLSGVPNDVTTASADAIAAGTLTTFAVLGTLIAFAILIAT